MAANRGEIAIRIFRAATELGIRTVAMYSNEDRFSLHRFKADESYLVGEGKGPVQAYLDIADILRIAKAAQVDAIHPGYGFLAEDPEFAAACVGAGIIFVGPPAETMRLLGNKIAARQLALEAGVPVMPASGALGTDAAAMKLLAGKIGYPVMVKASWGGGGRGMRLVREETELVDLARAARAEARAAFGKDEIYLEKVLERARHVEVQFVGDSHGTIVHLYERDCTVQRRNQKVVERAPAPYLDDRQRDELCRAALKIAGAASYVNAGTAEFLMDKDTGQFYFIEVNPRIQVEHTVTEMVTGIDLVKAQISIAMGGRVGAENTGVPRQQDIRLNGHALQCRITTEDPINNFIPDYGRIKAYRGATGFGIRLDGGTAYSGALVTRYYDSLLEKVTAWGATAARSGPPNGSRPARVPHPRRLDQPAIRRGPHFPPEVSVGGIYDDLHRRYSGALRAAEAQGPGDQAPVVHRRCHRQRQCGSRRPPHGPALSGRRKPPTFAAWSRGPDCASCSTRRDRKRSQGG